MAELSRADLQPLAERLLKADLVGALTGAGVSKESGVPTFREADGLWNKFRPEELANVDAFISNPKRVWDWYNWRRDLMGKVDPNPGHIALVQFDSLLEEFVLVTQNVDNLHNRAGSANVIELHGNIERNKCHSCGRFVDEVVFEKDTLPKCDCGGMIRPDVVWFGEMLPEQAITTAWQVAEKADVFFSIGTSAAVYPAAALPFEAKRAGAYVVEINPVPTELSRVADLVLQGPSGEILPRIADVIREVKGE